MNYGFIKACAVSPALRVADCPYNAQKTIEAMQQAAEDQNREVPPPQILLPECGKDLHHPANIGKNPAARRFAGHRAGQTGR